MNVILMSGISGAGKDTWLSARFDMEAVLYLFEDDHAPTHKAWLASIAHTTKP